MNLIVDDSYTLFSVQQEFNRLFPYLKINFYTATSRATGVAQWKILEASNITLGEFLIADGEDDIVITPDTTVSDLERKFNTDYKLMAQVYRSSGRMWLATNATDSWTLEEQNKQGKALSA